ncbi:hypothetical protein LTR27_008528 [Elasticomyces elasticus]|nr:hypothetical protein LTR27_008528 [Elasticomyces elasticus]
MPPKVISKNNDRPGGVLPVNAAARAAPSKSSLRLKIEVRRLPPSLTLSEYEEVLGDEWKLGRGKVDWREYRPGKLKAPGKLPEQSRCYVHLAHESYVKDFEQRFLSVVFHDKAGSHRNPDIKHLPPTLGFATNQRTPLQVKMRVDGRQGTIDQDAEFIAFLEAETMPLAKPTALEILSAEKEKGGMKVKSTPLIEDLRAKKELRAKVAAEKVEKKKADDKKAAQAKSDAKEAEKTALQLKVEQAAKEAAKVLNKQAAVKQQTPAVTQPVAAKPTSPARTKRAVQSPKPQNAAPANPATAAASPAPERRPAPRQRNNADGIRKMLQKDLGIRPKPAAATQPTNAPAASKPAQTTTASPASSTPTSPPPVTSPVTQPPVQQPKPNPAPPKPATTPTTLKAYLKHANPSQGMTEMLILRALAEYGEVANVTIDPRKGTGIAVFRDAEGLKKAMAAKRVTVAKGAVEVMEFRDRSGEAMGPRGGGVMRGRGGFRGGRGGRVGPVAAVNATVTAPQAPAPVANATAASPAAVSTPSTPATTS